MTKLIGHITYPKEATFAVEYTKLYRENDTSLLEFRLINNGRKTVSGYHVDISYRVNGQEKHETLQGIDLDLKSHIATDAFTVTLNGAVEEGSITLSAVLYDDLSSAPSTSTFPFASYEVVTRVAENELLGTPIAASSKTPAFKNTQRTKNIPTSSANQVPPRAPVTPAAPPKETPPAQKSRLPLILALTALGGMIGTFLLRIVAYAFIADTFGTPDVISNMYLTVSVGSLALFASCASFAMTAILLSQKNPDQRGVVILFSILTLVGYLYFVSMYSAPVAIVLTLILVVVFFILALRQKNAALLSVVSVMFFLLWFMFIGFASGCDLGGCQSAEEAPMEKPQGNMAYTTTAATEENATPIAYATDYIELIYSHYDPGERVVSGYSRFSSSEPVALYSTSQIPVIDGTIDLVIPEFDGEGNRVVAIGVDAFSYDGYIVSVTLPSSVRVIEQDAFRYCFNLKTADLGRVEVIAESAFRECYELQSVTVLENINAIQSYAFEQCTSLQSIALGENLQSIGCSAFFGTALTEIVIPESVSYMESAVFGDCPFLQEVFLYASIEQIPQNTFYGCTSLRAVRIPQSVRAIYDGAFGNCPSLILVVYIGEHEEWDSVLIGMENDALYQAEIECRYE